MAVQNICSKHICIYIDRVIWSLDMPVTTIYLDDELFEFIRKNKSKIIQEALRQYKEKIEQGLNFDRRC